MEDYNISRIEPDTTEQYDDTIKGLTRSQLNDVRRRTKITAEKIKANENNKKRNE